MRILPGCDAAPLPACLQERLRTQAAAREVAEVKARAFKARPSPVKALAAQHTPPKPTPASPTQVRACDVM
jgi:hypothetical protein